MLCTISLYQRAGVPRPPSKCTYYKRGGRIRGAQLLPEFLSYSCLEVGCDLIKVNTGDLVIFQLSRVRDFIQFHGRAKPDNASARASQQKLRSFIISIPFGISTYLQ
jgi:hypothetical protein